MSEAATLQTMLGQAGACPEIRLGDKTWRFGHPTQRAKAVLEELIAANALAEVRALKASLPPADYKELFSETAASISAGDYRTWKPNWNRALETDEGKIMLMLSFLRECHPHATRADVLALVLGAREEVSAAMDRITPPFWKMLLETTPMSEEQRTMAEKELLANVARLMEKNSTSTPQG